MTRLSVVVPCFNEEDVIDTLRRADAARCSTPCRTEFEICYVDDGSTGRRPSHAPRSSPPRDPRVRYVSFSRNFGKEAAMLAGLREAAGDAVVIMDADLQHPPRAGRAACSSCTRRATTRSSPAAPARATAVRRTLSRASTTGSINRLVDVELVDGVGDFRLLSRRAVDALLALPEYNRFSKGLFSWIGFRHRRPSTTRTPQREAGRAEVDVRQPAQLRPRRPALLQQQAAARRHLARRCC